MLTILGAVGTACATVLALLIAFEALPKERRDWWLARIRRSDATEPTIDLIPAPAAAGQLPPPRDAGAVSEGVLPSKPPADLIDHNEGVEFDFARTIEEVRQVSSYDTEHYIPDDTIGFEELLGWWRAFPKGLIVARSPTGAVVGCLGLWPVAADWFVSIPDHANPEKFITPDMISAAVSGKISAFYIGGIGVADHNSFLGKQHAVLMMWFALDHVLQMKNVSRKAAFYAIPATPSGNPQDMPGERMIRNMKFELVAGRNFKPELYCTVPGQELSKRVHRLAAKLLSRRAASDEG